MKRTGNQTSDMEKGRTDLYMGPDGLRRGEKCPRFFGSFRQWVIGGLAWLCFLYVLESCMMRWFSKRPEFVPSLFSLTSCMSLGMHLTTIALCPYNGDNNKPYSKKEVWGFFIIYLFFNWRIIALQHWFDFSHTLTRESAIGISCPSLPESLSHLSPFPAPVGCYRAPVWVPESYGRFH